MDRFFSIVGPYLKHLTRCIYVDLYKFQVEFQQICTQPIMFMMDNTQRFGLEHEAMSCGHSIHLVDSGFLLVIQWRFCPKNVIVMIACSHLNGFSRWWFQTFFIFTLILGKMIDFDFRIFFKEVVQPPPSFEFIEKNGHFDPFFLYP